MDVMIDDECESEVSRSSDLVTSGIEHRITILTLFRFPGTLLGVWTHGMLSYVSLLKGSFSLRNPPRRIAPVTISLPYNWKRVLIIWIQQDARCRTMMRLSSITATEDCIFAHWSHLSLIDCVEVGESWLRLSWQRAFESVTMHSVAAVRWGRFICAKAFVQLERNHLPVANSWHTYLSHPLSLSLIMELSTDVLHWKIFICARASLLLVTGHSISIWVCYGCTSLLRITIPSTVADISAWAFDGCTSLVKVQLQEGLRVKPLSNMSCYQKPRRKSSTSAWKPGKGVAYCRSI